MKRTRFNRVLAAARIRPVLLCAAAVLLSSAPAGAQSLPQDRLRNGAVVRGAFRKLVADHRTATVVVLSQDKQVALGALVAPDGYIITKADEIDGRTDLHCRLHDGRKLPAHVVGVHDEYDLAMLKVEADGLPAVRFHTAGDPSVGQWLVTVGSGELPVAVGVMSVKRRSIPMPRAVLGVIIADDRGGVRIKRIFPNSGADKAGLKVGDVITWVAGKVIKEGEVLSATISRYRPGDTLKLRVRRGDSNDEVTVEATLGSPFSNPQSRNYIQNHMGGKLSERRDGFPAVLQHDTVLRPEDCGGPVIDLRGRVVGINIARAGRVESYAIPAECVASLLPELKSGRLAPERSGPPPPPLPDRVAGK